MFKVQETEKEAREGDRAECKVGALKNSRRAVGVSVPEVVSD